MNKDDSAETKHEPTKTMLTIREASRLLNVHCNTLRRWSEQGIIKAYRIGPRGDRRFRREDIASILLVRTKNSRMNASKLSRQ